MGRRTTDLGFWEVDVWATLTPAEVRRLAPINRDSLERLSVASATLADVRIQRLDDLTRHWRRLLSVADSDGLAADELRQSLASLNAAIDAGNTGNIRAALDEVRHHGQVVEHALRAPGGYSCPARTASVL